MKQPAPGKEFFAVDNFPAVYAHTQETWQDPELAAKYHSWASNILKPHVVFADGVEDRMTQETRNGALAAIAFTHGSNIDPLQIAAMAWQQRAFDELIGKTMIGAKVSLFSAPGIGSIVPHLGAVPVYRKKDVLEKGQTPEEQERLLAVRKEAGKAFIATEIAGMNDGHHMAKHVEGTRNKKNPQKIQTVFDGYGRVVCGVNPDVDILMMTAAFHYGKVIRLNRTRRKPTIYLDIPQDQRRIEPEQVTRIIEPSLQETLDHAVALHRRWRPLRLAA